MIDARFDVLAEVLIGFSTNLQKGERVLIDAFDAPPEMVIATMEVFPYVTFSEKQVGHK